MLHDAVSKFDNLPLDSLEALWRCFTETFSTFALGEQELTRLLSVLTPRVITWGAANDAQSEMAKLSSVLFKHWSTLASSDHSPTSSSKVDGFEVITALLAMARMDTADKVNYLFDCMNCEGDNDLDAVEVALGLKSVQGACVLNDV